MHSQSTRKNGNIFDIFTAFKTSLFTRDEEIGKTSEEKIQKDLETVQDMHESIAYLNSLKSRMISGFSSKKITVDLNDYSRRMLEIAGLGPKFDVKENTVTLSLSEIDRALNATTSSANALVKSVEESHTNTEIERKEISSVMAVLEKIMHSYTEFIKRMCQYAVSA